MFYLLHFFAFFLLFSLFKRHFRRLFFRVALDKSVFIPYTIKTFDAITLKGSFILRSFGLYNVHAFSGVTEGGVLGLTLLLYHWFGLSPSISGLVLNAACYIGGWRTLGRSFIFYSVIAGGGFSAFYAVFERFDPLWPQLAQMPLVAAIVGALFVGIGVGLSVRAGGAPGGDDALAMTLHEILHQPIERIYLASDLIVLALSATYLPLNRLACSLIGLIQRIPSPLAQKGEELSD